MATNNLQNITYNRKLSIGSKILMKRILFVCLIREESGFQMISVLTISLKLGSRIMVSFAHLTSAIATSHERFFFCYKVLQIRKKKQHKNGTNMFHLYVHSFPPIHSTSISSAVMIIISHHLNNYGRYVS